MDCLSKDRGAHKTRQVKYKQEIKRAKRQSKNCLQTKITVLVNRSWNTSRTGNQLGKAVQLLDDKCAKSADGDDTVVAEKLSEFFTSAFTDEIFGEISTPNALSVANLVEEPDQSEIKSENTRPNKEARC